MAFNEGGREKQFGKGVLGYSLWRLAVENKEIKPIIDALKTGDLAGAKNVLLDLRKNEERGFAEGLLYEGG